MNWDQVKGNWKQVQGKVKEKWGKLTDDDLTTIAGKRDQLAGKLQVDVVTARAVAPLDRLAGWALPLLPTGGRLLALKGEQAATELATAAAVLHRLGAASTSLVDVGTEGLGTFARVVVVERGQSAGPRSGAPRFPLATEPVRRGAAGPPCA